MSGQETPTSYSELAAVIAALPLLLREARRSRQLSMRAAASQLGMSPSTVLRIEGGEDCALSNATAVLRWLDSSSIQPRSDAGLPADGEERTDGR